MKILEFGFIIQSRQHNYSENLDYGIQFTHLLNFKFCMNCMYFPFLFLFWRLKHAPTLKVSLTLYDVTIQFSFSCIHADLYFVCTLSWFILYLNFADTVPPTANITASTDFTNALNVSINISFSEPCTGGPGFVCSSVNACYVSRWLTNT